MKTDIYEYKIKKGKSLSKLLFQLHHITSRLELKYSNIKKYEYHCFIDDENSFAIIKFTY